jgi:predicted amidohydrolase
MPSSSSVRVACAQVAPVVGDPARNREIARDAIARGAAAGARIVVLPELLSSGYVFRSAEEAAALAEPPDGPALTAWREAAARADVTVVGGFCERGEDGRTYNAAAIVDAGGTRAVYRKIHLWDREQLWFTPGTAPCALHETQWGRIAVAVCYDLEFPEYVHVLALAGADLICAPTNWPREPRPAGERPIEVIRTQASAAVNRVFIAACDRHGRERDVDWTGASVIAEPRGWLLAGPPADFGEDLLVADCDLALARDKRFGERNHAFDDRFPDLYATAAAAAREARGRSAAG